MNDSSIFPSDQTRYHTDTFEYIRSSISQHTKEIAVINTTLADMKKDKISTSFTKKVNDFMLSTEQRIDRLSTSIKLFTNHVFQNESSVKSMIESTVSKITENQRTEQMSHNTEILNTLMKTMEDIQKTQKNILERLDSLENNKQESQKKKVRFAKSNVTVFDVEPAPFTLEKMQNSESLVQITDFVKQKMSELEKIRTVQEENNARFGKFIQVSQDAMNKLNGDLKLTKAQVENQLTKVSAEMDKFMTREDIVMLMHDTLMQSPSFSRTTKMSRPGTAIIRQTRIEQDNFLPTVSVQMISGDSITRPSTTHGGRSYPVKKGRQVTRNMY